MAKILPVNFEGFSVWASASVADVVMRRRDLFAVAFGEKLPNYTGSGTNASKSKQDNASQLQRKYEQIKLLPCEKQEFVLQFLDTVLDNQQKQKV